MSDRRWLRATILAAVTTGLSIALLEHSLGLLARLGPQVLGWSASYGTAYRASTHGVQAGAELAWPALLTPICLLASADARAAWQAGLRLELREPFIRRAFALISGLPAAAAVTQTMAALARWVRLVQRPDLLDGLAAALPALIGTGTLGLSAAAFAAALTWRSALRRLAASGVPQLPPDG